MYNVATFTYLKHVFYVSGYSYDLCICTGSSIGLIGRVFANGLGDRGSIPGWFILWTQKMVLDASLLNTQHY